MTNHSGELISAKYSASLDRQVEELVKPLGIALNVSTRWLQRSPLYYLDKDAMWGGIPVILEAYVTNRTVEAVEVFYVTEDACDSLYLVTRKEITHHPIWRS